MNKREAREKLIDAGLLALAHKMEGHGLGPVLEEIFGGDTDVATEVFADMMRKRGLWDAYNNGLPTPTPPPVEMSDEYLFVPGRIYPRVGTRPVRWGQITKTHFSAEEFKYADKHKKMETICGLRIPTLAVIMPMDKWHPGSPEMCRTCVSLRGDLT